MKFTKYLIIYALISSLVLIPGIFFLARHGLRLSVDFTGGSLIEFQIDKSKVKSRLSAVAKAKEEPFPTEIGKFLSSNKITYSSLQTTGNKTYILKTAPIDEKEKQKTLTLIDKKFGKTKEVRFETVGPLIGKELINKTLIGAALGILGILCYVAYAFKNFKYGASAVLALFHDLLVLTGVFAILGKLLSVEVDALFVTALLTTMSSSVHDTIVVFDRIRETKRLHPTLSLEDTINSAMSQTMVRSLNNSLTIIFMLLSLFLLGGETIKWFIFALLVGTITGTYSSPFVATPILYLWEKFEEKKK